MNAMTRWDPFREMETFREAMDRMFDEPWRSQAGLGLQRSEGFPLALDVAEDNSAYIVKASIPGVDPEQIEITLTDNVLTIKGETKSEQDSGDKNYHVRERRFGSFMRSVTLPMPVDTEKVEATHENGVLTLRLPKTEAVKPKRISVNKTISGQSAAGHSGNGHPQQGK
jgi:HSP20 family protein